MNRPKVFAELFAGAAAASLRLVGGSSLQPPVAWMGGKRRYSSHILATVGLNPGQGCDHLLLADAGPWGWVWPVLLQRDSAQAVAKVLRRWGAEPDFDPRALWARLAELPPAEDLPERVAQWLWLQGRAGGGVPVFWRDRELTQGERDREGKPKLKKPGQKGIRLSQVSRTGLTRAGQNKPALLQGSAGGRPPQPAGQRNTSLFASDGRGVLRAAGQKASGGGSGGLVDIGGLADRLELLAESVAHWLCLQAGGALGKPVTRVSEDGTWHTHGYAHLTDSARAKGFQARLVPTAIAGRVEQLPAPSVTVHHGDSYTLALELAEHDLTGWVVYLDPPYVGCTGYGWDCLRDQVLEMALRLRAAGAIVIISEAVGLAGELGPDWHEQEITSLGTSRSKSEWLTLSVRPQVRADAQLRLALEVA